MTEEEGLLERLTDYWQCVGPDPRPLHIWNYLGSGSHIYRCQTCGLRVTKMKLKEETDNG